MAYLGATVSEETLEAFRERATSLHRDVSKHLRAVVEADLKAAEIEQANSELAQGAESVVGSAA